MVLVSGDKVAAQWHLKGVQGDKVALQWHLKGVQGDELQERPSLFPWAGVWEWHQGLLLDLVLGQDALLWPPCMELSLPLLHSTSILS